MASPERLLRMARALQYTHETLRVCTIEDDEGITNRWVLTLCSKGEPTGHLSVADSFDGAIIMLEAFLAKVCAQRIAELQLASFVPPSISTTPQV